MANGKFSPQLIAGVCVAVFFGASLLFRIVFPYDHVFVGDWIKFTGTDAWYHMRIIDNLAHNFPHLNTIDPYLLYPSPMNLTERPERFFDYFFAAVIWLISLGSPSQHIVDVIGVYLPAILGALVVVPVYFMGKILINRWVGVIAAGLMAFSPGEFLGRSILGQTDNHVFEVLFSTTAILFVFLALQCARQRQLTFLHLLSLNWTIIARPLLYSILASVFFTIYLNSWQGALLFLLILFLYFLVQSILDYFRGVPSDYLCFVSSVTFLVTLIFTLLLPHTSLQIAALIIAFITTMLVGVLSRLMAKYGIKAGYYLLTLIGVGLAGLVIFYGIKADLFNSMLSSFSVLLPIGARLTIEEASSILFPMGEFSFEVVWLNFTTGSILALVALGIFMYAIVKGGEADKTLLVIWSLVILLITLSMRRFAYYFAVNVAVLTAYVAWLILQFFGFRERLTEPAAVAEPISKKAQQKKLKRKDKQKSPGLVTMTFGAVLVFFLVLFPSIMYARELASFPQFTPSNAWSESLDWLREKTPQPYGSKDYYYELYDSKSFTQPPSAYGVAAHWDYGYWITKMGHRPPICNPGTTDTRTRGEVSKYFLAQDEVSAMARPEAKNSRYIMVDYETAMPLNKYYSWLEYAGIKQTEYYDVYVQRSGGSVNRVLLYYPEYYRSLTVRLYNFDGMQVVPRESTVISYEERITSEGQRYKEITSMKSFSNYSEALAFLQKQAAGSYRIVGADPFASPVPLESLKNYKLVYSSTRAVNVANVGRVPEVKIFEYILPK